MLNGMLDEARQQAAAGLVQAVKSGVLNLRAEVDPATAKAYFRLLGQYNLCFPDRVDELIDGIEEIIPDKHFSHGKQSDYYLGVGRDQSPVLYVSIGGQYVEHRNLDLRMSPALVDLLDSRFDALGKRARCDGAPYRYPHPYGWYQWRFWWD